MVPYLEQAMQQERGWLPMGIWIKAIAINVWIQVRMDRLVGYVAFYVRLGKNTSYIGFGNACMPNVVCT